LGKIRQEEEMRKHIRRLEEDLRERGKDPANLPERPEFDEEEFRE